MKRTELGLPEEQRTIVEDVGVIDGEHISAKHAIPGLEVCDFCNCVPVTFSYPCADVRIEIEDLSEPSRELKGAWAACDHCHDLIEADDRDGLVERSVGSFVALEGEMPEGVLREMRGLLRMTQAGFFDARQGDPEPL